MLDAFPPLPTASYTFDIEVETPCSLPRYKGSVLRGGFGTAFRLAMRQWGESDVYARIFEPTVDIDTATTLGIGQTAPRPFVLVPPLTDATELAPGERHTIGVVLFGPAIAALPYFVHTFEVLGTRFGIGRGRRSGNGRFVLQRVRDEHGRVVYRAGRGMTGVSDAMTEGGVPPGDAAPARVLLRFLTPTRIRTSFRRERRGLMMLRTGDDALALVDAIHRRVHLLSQLYGQRSRPVQAHTPLALDGPGPVVDADRLCWYDWERYSGRQRQAMKLGGFVGDVTLAGDVVRHIFPLLHLGARLHVGTSTTFGLGKFEVWRA